MPTTVNKKVLATTPAPRDWEKPCTHTEYTYHQLAPYIGKIKSSIAGHLVERYSSPGDLVVDPFAGAGTIPLEAVSRGRRTLAADISPYACLLARAKLFPPKSLKSAIDQVGILLEQAEAVPSPDLRQVPRWVRSFFHPDTLRECLRFAQVAKRPGNEFILACFLGILHHQRPGFLSYPSSHLVPYLRDKKYPRLKFPEMYAYRELGPRLLAKVRRSFRRHVAVSSGSGKVYERPISRLKFPKRFDALITSPPYMNALDYGRDNRLRLWFLSGVDSSSVDNGVTQRQSAFIDAIECLGRETEEGLRPRGYCVLVVGESLNRNFKAHPSEVVADIFKREARSLRLKEIIVDKIPDVRRTRRECRAIKTENILVFQKK